MMHSRITKPIATPITTTTSAAPAYRSSKRNDSSAFNAAFLNMCKPPQESEYSKLKSEVLKTAGSSIADTTPTKTPAASVSIPTQPSPSLPPPNLDSPSPNATEKSPQDETSPVAQNPSPAAPPPKPPVAQKSQKPPVGIRPKPEAKKEAAKKVETAKRRSASKMVPKKNVSDDAPVPAVQQKVQTETETLRARISALNARIRKLETENAKLKQDSVPVEEAQKVVSRCSIEFSESTKEDPRRTTFLKDKVGYLQNQVDLLKKGLAFHRPIVYNTECFVGEAIGAIEGYFAERKGEFDDIRVVECKLDSLKNKLCQTQKTFSEKWKEFGTYIDKSISDYEDELRHRAANLGEIEEGLYQFAVSLNAVTTNQKGGLTETEAAIPLVDKAKYLIEQILTQGIEYVGNKPRGSHKEHALAKQLFLQEFDYKKEDEGITEGFRFVTEKLCADLFDCCYGIMLRFFLPGDWRNHRTIEKKKPQMEEIIRHLKEIERTFTVDIQIREKQLYLYKSYTESFKGTHSKTFNIFAARTKEVSDHVSKYLQEPFQDIVEAAENAKENASPTAYIALCGVIDHVSETMSRGFDKVLTLLKNDQKAREEVTRPTDRFGKFMHKSAVQLEQNVKVREEAKKYFN